jgi:hypothetical protein
MRGGAVNFEGNPAMKLAGLATGLATVALIATTTAVLAEAAVVTRNNTKVYRSATSSRVVDSVDRGDVVDADRCSKGRCRVDIDDDGENDGWIRQDRLATYEYDDDDHGHHGGHGDGGGKGHGGGGGKGGKGGGGKGSDDPQVQMGFGVDANGQPTIQFGVKTDDGSFGFQVGGGGGGQQQPQGGQPQACFFEHDNYAGASFCVAKGQQIPNLQNNGWNDTVSSVAVYGGANVKACVDAGFSGGCYDWSSNQNGMPGGFNDQMSSIYVY